MGKAIRHILYIKIYIHALNFPNSSAAFFNLCSQVIILSSFIYVLFSLIDFYMSLLWSQFPVFFFFLRIYMKIYPQDFQMKFKILSRNKILRICVPSMQLNKKQPVS